MADFKLHFQAAAAKTGLKFEDAYPVGDPEINGFVFYPESEHRAAILTSEGVPECESAWLYEDLVFLPEESLGPVEGIYVWRGVYKSVEDIEDVEIP